MFEGAAEALQKLPADDRVVWWMSAESPYQVTEGLASLAKRLELVWEHAVAKSAAEASKKWLETQRNWLHGLAGHVVCLEQVLNGSFAEVAFASHFLSCIALAPGFSNAHNSFARQGHPSTHMKSPAFLAATFHQHFQVSSKSAMLP